MTDIFLINDDPISLKKVPKPRRKKLTFKYHIRAEGSTVVEIKAFDEDSAQEIYESGDWKDDAGDVAEFHIVAEEQYGSNYLYQIQLIAT